MVEIDGFGAFLVFAVCLIQAIAIGLRCFAGEFAENSGEISRVGEAAGPGDFGYVK